MMDNSEPFDPRDISDLDNLVHSPTRLKIMLVLMSVEEADFTFISKAADLTRGNLSANLTKLEEAGYVEIEKKFIERVPKTIVRISESGAKALETYSNILGPILDELRK
jgi:DNA-binding MarR family transcriptional regulator